MDPDAAHANDLWIGLAIVLLGGLFWLLPIILGVRTARRKGRSPHWMWFGLHPFAGWITYVVLCFLPPLKECPQCRESARADASICPHCRTRFE